MLFSVITVTYNNLEGLKRTAATMTRQECTDYEWIVIDGGSSDGSAAFLPTTTALWQSAADGGIYDAMNKGIAQAQGEYLVFMNAGDVFASPDVLTQIKIRAGGRPDFIYGDAIEDGHFKKARAHHKILRGMFTHHQAMFYRRALIGDLRYDTTFKIAADYKFTMKFLQKSQRVLYCALPVCIFETGGLSQRQARAGRREQHRIRRQSGQTGFIGCVFIYGAQSLALMLRRIAPSLYWKIKS